VFNWRHYPIIRFILPFIAGILFGIYSSVEGMGWAYVAAGLTALMIAFKIFKLGSSYKFNWLNGVIANAALFTLAVFLVIWNTPNLQQDFYKNQSYTWIVAKIKSPLVEKEKTYQAKLEIQATVTKGIATEASGTILTYLEKSHKTEQLPYGQIIAIQIELNEIDGPKNPGQFNYQEYMRFHGIYESGYVPANKLVDLQMNEGVFFMEIADGLRKRFLTVLKSSGLETEQFPIASALVLGQREFLDPDTIRSYSSAGAMHVLAVSGLHVGIIYMVLNFLLQFLDRKRRSKIIKAVILLLILWIYAMITGLSPSVLRATTMFSFIIIAAAMNRNTNVYNTIAASALLLLVIDPFLIMQVGFQLSYLAVLGIIYFQPKIYNLFYFRNKLLNYVWQISAVSIAAQLATFPLGLLYFHQFPVYFIVSNLIVIPCAFIILALGMVTIATGFSDIVSGWFGYLLNKVIWILNQGVGWIESLPFSLIEGVAISVVGCWLLYFAVFGLVGAIERRKFGFIIASASFILILFAIDFAEDVEQKSAQEICVYSTRSSLAIDFIKGNEHVFVSSELFYSDWSQMLFHVKHNWYEQDLNSAHFVRTQEDSIIHELGFEKQQNLMNFYGKLICFLDALSANGPSIAVDVLIVDDFWKYYNNRSNLKCNQLVFTESVSNWQLDKLEGSNFHSLKDGAFLLKF
jgi:competence protein ComEC